jgi:formamidopyrimidine-DNA glycosylase
VPELPEVESTVQFLSERVLGRTVTGVFVGWAKTLHGLTPSEFQKRMLNLQFVQASRRGKFVVFGMGRGGSISAYLLGHMRMSGSFDVVRSEEPRAAHDRLIVTLENGKEVRFNDPRKFGRIYLVSDPAVVTGSLGIEPLSIEFTAERLQNLMSDRRGAIKSLLLNQSLIAGIGNIYADEALWDAKVHPLTPGNSLTTRAVAELHRAIQETLREAISRHGTDAGDGVVEGGMYEPKVYARAEEPCLRCGSLIVRTVVGQRGTHFCPRCQRKPGLRRR